MSADFVAAPAAEVPLPGGFVQSPLTTAAVQELESAYVPLADAVRALVDATIRTRVPLAQAHEIRQRIEELTALLRADQLPGPAGVAYNDEGHSWQWGNAAVGPRNAAAPPLLVHRDDDGVVRGEAFLGAAAEGPPGHVHGGMAALLLDHLMGVTASEGERQLFTGTLTLRYRAPTPLGPVRLEAWVSDSGPVKVVVQARLWSHDVLCVEADGVFIVPRWARSTPEPEGPSSP